METAQPMQACSHRLFSCMRAPLSAGTCVLRYVGGAARQSPASVARISYEPFPAAGPFRRLGERDVQPFSLTPFELSLATWGESGTFLRFVICCSLCLPTCRYPCVCIALHAALQSMQHASERTKQRQDLSSLPFERFLTQLRSDRLGMCRKANLKGHTRHEVGREDARERCVDALAAIVTRIHADILEVNPSTRITTDHDFVLRIVVVLQRLLQACGVKSLHL